MITITLRLISLFFLATAIGAIGKIHHYQQSHVLLADVYVRDKVAVPLLFTDSQWKSCANNELCHKVIPAW
jgi:hypothetical protein